MKAAVFMGPGRALVVEERPDPNPGNGQVVIKVGRCGICTSDLHMTSGNGVVTLPPGSALGHEYSGEVVGLGPNTQFLRVGDRIAAMPLVSCGICPECAAGSPISCPQVTSMTGGYGQYTLTDERSAIKLPAALSMSDGALVEPLASALHGVAMADVGQHSRVVVLGVGPIGLGVIYWAKRFGVQRIVAVARSDRNADLAMKFGATAFLTQNAELAQSAAGAIGGPAHVVFECVGAPGALPGAIALVAARGLVVMMGMCTVADSITPFLAGMKNVQIRFSAAYSIGDFQRATDALDSGAVQPRAMITDTIDLERLPAMFEALRSPSHHCKVLVNPWHGEH